VPVFENDKIVDLPADNPNIQSHKSLLRELDLPSELAGLRFKDPVAGAIKDEIHVHLFEPGWHYSDEENLYDVWDRAGKILEYLQDRPEQTIAVVAHGGILKACLARVLQKESAPSLTLRQQLEVYQSISAQTWWDNTGVVSLRYSPEENWQWLMTDNQHIGPAYFGFMNPPSPVTAPEKSDTAPGDIYEKK
jgi:broad specificity phosphatase PhoE